MEVYWKAGFLGRIFPCRIFPVVKIRQETVQGKLCGGLKAFGCNKKKFNTERLSLSVKMKYLKKCVKEQSAVRMKQEENLLEIREMSCTKNICA